MKKASELVADLALPAGRWRFTVAELNAFADERHEALEAVLKLEAPPTTKEKDALETLKHAALLYAEHEGDDPDGNPGPTDYGIDLCVAAVKWAKARSKPRKTR